MSTAGLAGKLRQEGVRGVAARAAKRAFEALGGSELDRPLLPGDVADLGRLRLPTAPRREGRLRIGWLTTPPSPGSGGHTTLFRMVRACERAGHECTVLLYDRHHGDVASHRAVIRQHWPSITAQVREVGRDAAGLAGLDACVATSWPTAHVLATRPAAVHRLYFIQDYEPFFHPRGDVSELAADTYRFGFTNLALGHMVQGRLWSELGVPSTLLPFSVDTEVYGLRAPAPGAPERAGVVLYAKRDNPRRALSLGVRALAELQRRRPDVPIHLYGDSVPELTGRAVVRHDRLTPPDLDALYNRVVAGLALSFTNISLVAEEMLASGVVPVVNDSPDARADIPSRMVAWAGPSPTALADALCAALDHPDRAAQARAAASSVRTDCWQMAGEGVVAAIEATVAGRRTPGAVRERRR